MKHLSASIISAGLRALTLLSRFVLMFFLARVLSPAEVGLFGLYWAGLQLASSLQTLDVYSYTVRIFLDPTSDIKRTTSLHMGFVTASIFLLTPISTFFFAKGGAGISESLLIVFLLHLPLEIISTDVGRLLIPLGKPLLSNTLLFIRSGLWTFPFIGLAYFNQLDSEIFTVVKFWLAGSALAAILSLLSIYRATEGFPLPTVDIQWIKKALIGTGLFFIATLLFRTVLGIDRFIVSHFWGLDAAGIYSLFASVCLGVLGLLESGVSALHYPELVRNIQKRDKYSVKTSLASFTRKNNIATGGLMVSILILFPIASSIYLNSNYNSEIGVFFAIAFGVAIYCLSMPYHYVIYGFRADNIMVYIYTSAFVVLILSAIILSLFFKTIGAGLMLSLALTTIGAGRFFSAHYLLRKL